MKLTPPARGKQFRRIYLVFRLAKTFPGGRCHHADSSSYNARMDRRRLLAIFDGHRVDAAIPAGGRQ